MQTRLVDLVLNLLRKDQYAAADENPDELYLVTDDAGITGADVVNALGYVPYNGTTNPDHYITSSSIPTVGNGTIRIKQDNKIQQFTVNQTATQLISLNGLYDYYTINATVHSSPTISGARVSDFSNGWLSTQYQFPNNWEISTTFFLDNPPSETADEEEQMIIYSPNLAVRLDGIDDDEDAMSVHINGTWYNLGAHPYSGESYQVTISSYNQADGVHTVGTYVYVYSPSADEELYNAKLTSNVVAPTNIPVEIQFGAYNGTGPLYATMYFDETYINVLDGATTRYWTGAEKTIDTKANKDDIKNGTLTITQGGVTKGTFTTNQSTNTTIALDAGGGGSYSAGTGIDITNDTISIDTSVVAQLSDIPTNYVTTDTAQNITGRKTFLGEKAIYFKQSATTDKLGFTLYNPSDTELGAFEWRPSTISGGALLNINVPYSSSNYVGFRYWGTAVNIIAPKVATAGDYYIPTHITDGTNTVTANASGTVDISSLISGGGSGGIQNTATGTDSLTILGTPASDDNSINIGVGSQTSDDGSIAIGAGDANNQFNGAIAIERAIAIGSGYDGYNGASADGYSVAIGIETEAIGGAIAIGSSAKATAAAGQSIAIGYFATASGASSIALGDNAEATATNAYQIGDGTNNTASSFQVGSRQLLNITTGLIPDARLSSNIARTSQIPTVPTTVSSFTNDAGYITSASLPTLTYSSATETLTFG